MAQLCVLVIDAVNHCIEHYGKDSNRATLHIHNDKEDFDKVVKKFKYGLSFLVMFN